MKILIKLSVIIALLYTVSANADDYSQSYYGQQQNTQYASSGDGYLISNYNQDFLNCSNTAKKTSSGMSDSMYLGAFYGCMMNLGYKSADLF